jgi:hypothetical protein
MFIERSAEQIQTRSITSRGEEGSLTACAAGTELETVESVVWVWILYEIDMVSLTA